MFGNLLGMAASVIPQQQLVWQEFKRRVLKPGGVWVNEYAENKNITGSIQAVDLNSYQNLGFDSAKRYWKLYTSNPVKMTAEGGAPDIIHWQGKRMEPVGETPWDNQDGWRGVYLVEITKR